MSYVVNWSPASKVEYARILEGIEKKYGLAPVLKFMDKTDEVIQTISNHPEAGGKTIKEKVKRYVITKQTTLLYEVTNDRIELLHFWDTRKNPDKLEKAI
jgi:plasmid stabilization system protein ParE